MPRAKLDPGEALRRKQARALERRRLRQERKKAGGVASTRRSSKPEVPMSANAVFNWAEHIPQSASDLSWLKSMDIKSIANRIINSSRVRPYYLSIEWPSGLGAEPCSDFYPCGFFRSGDRLFYSFAFMEHRDAVFKAWRKELKALKETHHSVMKAHETK